MSSGPKRPYSQADFAAAGSLVSKLLEKPASKFPPSKFTIDRRITVPGLEGTAHAADIHLADLHLDDLFVDADKYQQQYTYSLEHNLPIFCVEDSESGAEPRPLILGMEQAQALYQSENPADALERLGIAISPSAKLVAYPAGAALGFFKFGMSDFVAARLAFFGSGPAKRYPFTVTTNTANLNVYWTQAGNLVTGKVFGYPSKTVKGTLPAGNYCFGAGSPGGTATYDMASTYYVPTLNSAHLNI